MHVPAPAGLAVGDSTGSRGDDVFLDENANQQTRMTNGNHVRKSTVLLGAILITCVLQSLVWLQYILKLQPRFRSKDSAMLVEHNTTFTTIASHQIRLYRIKKQQFNDSVQNSSQKESAKPADMIVTSPIRSTESTKAGRVPRIIEPLKHQDHADGSDIIDGFVIISCVREPPLLNASTEEVHN